MSGINFARKGLNQKIFSKRDMRATVGKKSSAMRSIMSNKEVAKVLDKSGERRVFYKALKERAQTAGTRGFTKKDMKKVLGDIEHSGQFSHKEMHKLGEELIGGAANSRIIREPKSEKHDSFSGSKSDPRSSVNMRKTFDEIINKDITKRFDSGPSSQKQGVANGGYLAGSNAQKLIFLRNNATMKKAQRENLIIEKSGEVLQDDSENFGYIPKYLENFYGDRNSDKIKSRLSDIQQRSEEEN
ncbi:MAG: hypothetical protein HGA61_00120 [Candidatus Moranbacteria bacterium]|nr:hypothetical protein [Candidatus Moranbacteria bacterium]